MIFGEKKVHVVIITKRKSPPSFESGQLNYSSLSLELVPRITLIFTDLFFKFVKSVAKGFAD